MGKPLLEPGRPLKAVVFDLDDTLVESTVNYGKFKAMVIEKLVSWGEDRRAYSPEETIVAIVSRYEHRMREQGVSAEELASRLAELDRIMDAVEMEKVSETKEIRGAKELLQLLKSRGIKVGILTRGCHDYAHAAMSATGLLHFVDAVECRNSKAKAKPNPESYLRLVRQLGVDREETIFIGDHPIDAQCATNAGVAFLAVRTGEVPDEVLEKAGSAKVFSSVGELVTWFEKLLKG